MDPRPYLYELLDRESSKWYIGCRTGAGCHPGELGINYFTSSRVVEPLFRAEPERFEKKILLVGPGQYIRDLEHEYLVARGARENPDSYNMFNAWQGFNPVKTGKFVAAENQRLRRGIFAQTPEERRLAGFNGGKLAGPRGGKTQGDINVKDGTLARAREAINWDNVRAKCRENLSNRTFEHKSALSKKISQRNWRCAECDMSASAGTLGYHQKISGHKGKINNV